MKSEVSSEGDEGEIEKVVQLFSPACSTDSLVPTGGCFSSPSFLPVQKTNSSAFPQYTQDLQNCSELNP